MTILEMQEEIVAAGWQFREHVFNDGDANNCMVDFTKKKDPTALTRSTGEFGWGRYAREDCWRAAYAELVAKPRLSASHG